MALRFSAALWRHDGGWWFVTLPAGVAEEVRDRAGARRGFGSVRVEVALTTDEEPVVWRTSVFPDAASGSFLLPVKAAVRVAADLEDGDDVELTLRLA